MVVYFVLVCLVLGVLLPVLGVMSFFARLVWLGGKKRQHPQGFHHFWNSSWFFFVTGQNRIMNSGV